MKKIIYLIMFIMIFQVASATFCQVESDCGPAETCAIVTGDLKVCVYDINSVDKLLHNEECKSNSECASNFCDFDRILDPNYLDSLTKRLQGIGLCYDINQDFKNIIDYEPVVDTKCRAYSVLMGPDYVSKDNVDYIDYCNGKTAIQYYCVVGGFRDGEVGNKQINCKDVCGLGECLNLDTTTYVKENPFDMPDGEGWQPGNFYNWNDEILTDEQRQEKQEEYDKEMKNNSLAKYIIFGMVLLIIFMRRK